ncbi:hypothetical protein QFC22_003614 [Naganishia vaughanmartiniae]|uniref:Uncharacterized protein n=1 Tax=Naganishia vaughanmartiniae TaxID=1424756 RepID=A0ACC2X526_9TREE|nr:hypothetical protein QFC22_003614 [Naganishia vaughanmartiniae]
MFRSALRSAAPRSARVVRATPARRWASTSSNHGSKSSDMTWAMGSAVVFGSAAAYLLLAGGDSHPAHVAVHQGTTHMKEFHDETNESKVPEDANTSVSAFKVDKGIAGRKEGVPQEKDAVPGEEESEKPVSGGQSSSSSSQKSSTPMEAADEGRLAEDIPSKEIEDSMHRADAIASPRAAMSQEAAGHGEGENSSFSSSSSSGGVAEGTMEAADEGRYAEDIPAAEIEESLHQAEIVGVPRAAMEAEVTGKAIEERE